MDSFDEELKERAKKEQPALPQGYEERMRRLCNSLVDEPTHPKRFNVACRRRWIAAAAAALFVILPNVSAPAAYAMQEIPLIGSVVRVVTLRNYFYQDEHHQISAQTPELQQAGNAGEQVNQKAGQYIDDLIQTFRQECENEGYQGLDITYEVVTDTPDWFALRVDMVESAGGSRQRTRIYNIDKNTDQLVTLSSLFGENSGYAQRLKEEVQKQAAKQMKDDPADEYFLNETFTIEADQNFYRNQEGLLVLVFDEYTIAPGAMGSPEFVIPNEISDELQNEPQK